MTVNSFLSSSLSARLSVLSFRLLSPPFTSFHLLSPPFTSFYLPLPPFTSFHLLSPHSASSLIFGRSPPFSPFPFRQFVVEGDSAPLTLSPSGVFLSPAVAPATILLPFLDANQVKGGRRLDFMGFHLSTFPVSLVSWSVGRSRFGQKQGKSIFFSK